MSEKNKNTTPRQPSFPGIIDSMIEGFQVIDSQWRYVYLNDAIIKQSQFTRDELMGHTMMEMYPGIEKTNLFSVLRTCMDYRTPQYMENEFVFPNKTVGWFLLSIQPVEEGIAILSVDITESKRLSDNLKNSFELISTQKKQLEEFCSTVSHNLRAPITNIMMLADYIDQSEDAIEKQLMISKLKQASSNLNETFNLLVESLHYQNEHNLVFEKIILKDLFDNILQPMSSDIKNTSADFQFDFSEVPHLMMPPTYASSIFGNLISNSLKFHHPQRPLKIKVRTKRSNDKVILSVKDNGLGFDGEKHRNNLFRIRKTFHPHPNSRGIGLFITRKQVESIGGRIWAESKPDEGATFYVEFLNQNI